jgi:hypothetical protein
LTAAAVWNHVLVIAGHDGVVPGSAVTAGEVVACVAAIAVGDASEELVTIAWVAHESLALTTSVAAGRLLSAGCWHCGRIWRLGPFSRRTFSGIRVFCACTTGVWPFGQLILRHWVGIAGAGRALCGRWLVCRRRGLRIRDLGASRRLRWFRVSSSIRSTAAGNHVLVIAGGNRSIPSRSVTARELISHISTVSVTHTSVELFAIVGISGIAFFFADLPRVGSCGTTLTGRVCLTTFTGI